MSDTSRRSLIAMTGAGAAAGAVTLATGGAATAATPKAGRAREAVVAHVEDHTSDTLRLFVGEREVVVHDRDLVTRILNAAGGN